MRDIGYNTDVETWSDHRKILREHENYGMRREHHVSHRSNGIPIINDAHGCLFYMTNCNGGRL